MACRTTCSSSLLSTYTSRHCNSLQLAATRCNTPTLSPEQPHHTATHYTTPPSHCNTLHNTSITLQHTTQHIVCCITLQHTTQHLHHTATHYTTPQSHFNVLQNICITLQHTTQHLHHTATRYRTPALLCNTLQNNCNTVKDTATIATH